MAPSRCCSHHPQPAQAEVRGDEVCVSAKSGGTAVTAPALRPPDDVIAEAKFELKLSSTVISRNDFWGTEVSLPPPI